MQHSEITFSQIIKTLNSNINIPSITQNNLEKWNLTDAEKAFIKNYKPEKNLIVYGSLAPGEANHHIVEHIKGKWQKAIIKGKLEKEGWAAGMGYYGFRHTSAGEQDEIKAFVFTSDELIANWKQLDEFEGVEYKRILAAYQLDNGEVGCGYIYAINE